jgi:hypothetical protein
MLTDRGTNYTSEVLLETARLFNVQKLFTTPGHKGTNMMVASWQQDLQWDENLDLYEYALNVSYHLAVQNVPYVLWFCRAPTPLVELEDRADHRSGAYKWADRRAYAKQSLEKALEAVALVREAHLTVKADMKRRHDDSLKLVDLAVGDLCYRYNEAVPLRSEALPAKRLFRHWTGPYFVTDLKGENATVLDDTLCVSKTMYRNLLRRYVYPLAGLQLLGEHRVAYLAEVVAKRELNGELEYQCLWRSKAATELDWVAEENVPTCLVDEFEKRAAPVSAAFVVGV